MMGMRGFVFLVVLMSMGFAQSALELEVLQRTNQERVQRGLRALQWDNTAYQAAYGHAVDMLRRNFFEHVNPEGRNAAWRMRQAGVLDVTTGENLAVFENYPDAVLPGRSVVGWMNSPHHRENMLQPEFTHLGVAFVRQGNKVMVVQNFIGRLFEAQIGSSSAQVQRNILILSGTAPGTVGIFLGSGLYQRLNPPINVRLELPPNSSVRYGLFDGQTWWNTKPGERGLNLQTRLEVSTVAGRMVSLSLPAGQFNLALGEQPRFWQALTGPTTLNLPLAGSLEALWIGLRRGNEVVYAYRIPLK